MTTLYLLVLMSAFLGADGEGTVGTPRIVAQYVDPADCEQIKAVLTGSTMTHESLVCVPATSLRSRYVIPIPDGEYKGTWESR